MKTWIALVLLGLIPATLAWAQGPGRSAAKKRTGLQVGQLAPRFTIKSLDGKDTFSLEDYRKKKPVVLFFGSYT